MKQRSDPSCQRLGAAVVAGVLAAATGAAAADPATAANPPAVAPGYIVELVPTNRAAVPNTWTMAVKALEYLRKSQDADGGWSDKQYPSNSGVTALACLAFMVQGHPGKGPSAETLERGIRFLANRAQLDGRILASQDAPESTGVPEHCLATLALLRYLELKPDDKRVRAVVERALDVLPGCQHEDGGWRYAFSREGPSDSHVTGHALWALCYGRSAGFNVNSNSVRKGLAFIENCHLPDGSLRYRPYGIYSTLSGLSMIALELASPSTMEDHACLSHVLLPTNEARACYHCRRYSVEDLAREPHLFSRSFYEGIVLFRPSLFHGEWSSRPWFRKIAQVFQSTQRKNGEFHDEQGNSIYPAAMAAVVLQLPRSQSLTGDRSLLGLHPPVETKAKKEPKKESDNDPVSDWRELLTPQPWDWTWLSRDADPSWVWRETDEVRLAVVRHQLQHAETAAGARVPVFFLSIGRDADLNDELMRKFADHDPPVKKRSDAMLAPGEGAKDKRTGTTGILLALGDPVWGGSYVSGASIMMRAIVCAADGGLFLHRYYVGKKDSRWMVLKDELVKMRLPVSVEKEEHNIREALIRHQLGRLATEAGEVPSVFFVSLGQQKDPGDDFLRRFAARDPLARKRSDAILSLDEGIRDRQTGKPGAILEIGETRWKWTPSEKYAAEIESIVHTSGAGAFRHQYRIVQKAGQWRVVRDELDLIY